MATRPLNATAASLLGFLQDGPLTGWSIVAVAQETIGPFWSLTRSQVYRELAAMAADGLVEAGERGPRDRRPYRLTDAGRAAFETWVNRDIGDEVIRFPLLLTVKFGRFVTPPERLAALVQRQRALHAKRLAAYETMQTSAAGPRRDTYDGATLDFGLSFERMVLAWFERLPPSIRGGGPWPDDGGTPEG